MAPPFLLYWGHSPPLYTPMRVYSHMQSTHLCAHWIYFLLCMGEFAPSLHLLLLPLCFQAITNESTNEKPSAHVRLGKWWYREKLHMLILKCNCIVLPKMLHVYCWTISWFCSPHISSSVSVQTYLLVETKRHMPPEKSTQRSRMTASQNRGTDFYSAESAIQQDYSR